MLGYKWMEHKGKRIFFMDLVTDDLKALNETVSQIEKIFEGEPPKSILSLCSVEGITIKPELVQILKNFTKHNEPYVKMTCVLGVDGLRLIIFNSLLAFTRRKNLVLRTSKDQALDWLASQP